MTKIKIVFVSIFSLMLLVPLIGFRFGEGIVSEIDNRRLQENPFHAEERAKRKPMRDLISAYVSDRIGFRDDMIMAYTLLNDKLFGEMVHPSYCYGKDGYVFFKGMYTPPYNEYHETFANMIQHLQNYCEERGVTFLFVFEPMKQEILPQLLPAGVHYDNRWVKDFFKALDARGIHYIDNTVTMRERNAEGKAVFNPKYDALHWNDVGRFYGSNAILMELHKTFPGIKPNSLDNFEQVEELKTSLHVSRFPICEYVPVITVPLDSVEDITDIYKKELELQRPYIDFGYMKNSLHLHDTPKTLFFQGSHLNNYRSTFLSYALGEYIYVHNYQNIIEFPYYYNVFRPQCVVFEVSEMVLLATNYFDEKKMAVLNWNPSLQSIMEKTEISKEYTLPTDNISVQQGNALTNIIWKGKTDGIEYAWCILGDEFDMRPCKEGGYEVTVKNENWDQYKENLKIVTFAEGKLEMYIQ